jgi:Putative peptidoglycan binding domain.
VIDPDRTREIQAALIREHYLNGEPSGVWDSQTKAALTKFQSDNGWQTKIVPDSRALILSLIHIKDGLLNPESAAIGDVHELGAEKSIPGGSEPQK